MHHGNSVIKTDTDIVVVGAGIAGLSLALYVAEKAPELTILILSKGELPECNTSMAQGGVAVVTDLNSDSFEAHINDTLLAGKGLSNKNIVEKVIKDAPKRIEDLLRWGVELDADKAGFLLHREGGHSTGRVVHYKDHTGKEIHRKLLNRVKRYTNITVKPHCMVIDLWVVKNSCNGLYYYDVKSNQTILLTAKAVMLATGGCGQMFAVTTNSTCATGDGVAIATRAGAEIKDIQYYQFHPTALYQPGKHKAPLISEAVRGYGAQLVNESEQRFVFDYDPRGELATRDIVSTAIYNEMQHSGSECVYLRVKHLNQTEFAWHFPSIVKLCKNAGLELSKNDIPVTPAAHYQCGGIAVDSAGRTTIKRLYAGGECCCTGLHGANRLASNSLLEALVYAHESAEDIIELAGSITPVQFNKPMVPDNKKPASKIELHEISAIREELQNTITRVFHNKADAPLIKYAIDCIMERKKQVDQAVSIYVVELLELKNLLDNATLFLNALRDNYLDTYSQNLSSQPLSISPVG